MSNNQDRAELPALSDEQIEAEFCNRIGIDHDRLQMATPDTFQACLWFKRGYRAALAATAAPAVPEGYKLVPAEPTEKMFTAFSRQIEEGVVYVGGFLLAYRCMLDAAPTSAAQAAVQDSAPAPAKTIKLGSYGQAFDLPGDRRAYTYKHQPGNQAAWRIGDAASRVEAGGDLIDRGLSLLKALEAGGFGVFELDEAAATQAPAVGADHEPTEAQLVAGLKECEPLGELIDWREGFGRDEMRATYRAMLAAGEDQP